MAQLCDAVGHGTLEIGLHSLGSSARTFPTTPLPSAWLTWHEGLFTVCLAHVAQGALHLLPHVARGALVSTLWLGLSLTSEVRE